jgi:hypothetical protein
MNDTIPDKYFDDPDAHIFGTLRWAAVWKESWNPRLAWPSAALVACVVYKFGAFLWSRRARRAQD